MSSRLVVSVKKLISYSVAKNKKLNNFVPLWLSGYHSRRILAQSLIEENREIIIAKWNEYHGK